MSKSKNNSFNGGDEEEQQQNELQSIEQNEDNINYSKNENNLDNNFNISNKEEEMLENNNLLNYEINNENESPMKSSRNEAENTSQDEEIALIKMEHITICQFCKNNFDNNEHIPYLMKCGHFFCLKCINDHFTNEQGIICPSDGLVGQSIQELKLLNNLILDDNINEKNENNEKDLKNNNINNEVQNIINNSSSNNNVKYCNKHKNQKLTHIICQNNELLCIYCAFEKMKTNPNLEIKEINEQLNEFSNLIDIIISDTKANMNSISELKKKLSNSKNKELKKLNEFFKHLIDNLKNKNKEYNEIINEISSKNFSQLETNFKNFSKFLENCENFKKTLNKNVNENFTNLIDSFSDIKEKYLSVEDYSKFQNIFFESENEFDVINYINNTNRLQIMPQFIQYKKNSKKKHNDNENDFILNTNNNIYTINNDDNIFKRNKESNVYNITSENIGKRNFSSDKIKIVVPINGYFNQNNKNISNYNNYNFSNANNTMKKFRFDDERYSENNETLLNNFRKGMISNNMQKQDNNSIKNININTYYPNFLQKLDIPNPIAYSNYNYNLTYEYLNKNPNNLSRNFNI